MPRDGRPGIARPLLERVERELKLSGRTKVWLSKETGLARSTIDRLGTIGEAPQAATVVKIADALGIDRVEALELAGALPPERDQLMDLARQIRKLADRLNISYAQAIQLMLVGGELPQNPNPKLRGEDLTRALEAAKERLREVTAEANEELQIDRVREILGSAEQRVDE